MRALTPNVDLVLVVGDRESANSTRLSEIAAEYAKPSYLISNADAIQDAWLEGVETVLITSGASVPERLVQDVVERLNRIEPCEVEQAELVEENVRFRLPASIAK